MRHPGSRWPLVFLLANTALVTAAILHFANLDYPMVGHDYGLAIPQMLDAAVHFRVNGPGIQWYTPTFGGGLPAYPNPNNGQFSLLEILTVWIEPWSVVGLTTALFVTIGMFSTWRLLRVARFHPAASILGALFFSANGFMMERIAVGHLGYQPFPVLALVLVLLVDTALPATAAGMLLGLTCGILLQQAGYFLLLIFVISCVITLALLALMRPALLSVRRLAHVLGIGTVLGLAVSASKLAAVAAFMSSFPRPVLEDMATQPPLGIVGILLQLLGTMTLLPALSLSGLGIDTVANVLWATTGIEYFGYWELDMAMTPGVFLVLALGFLHLAANVRACTSRISKHRQWPVVAILVLSTWAGIEMTLARGYLFPLVRHLPILGSLHLSARSTAAFLLPVSVLAAWFCNMVASRLAPAAALRMLVFANAVALLPLLAWFGDANSLQNRNYDAAPSVAIHADILAGRIPDISGISDDVSQTGTLAAGLSNARPYEPIFGYHLENFHPRFVSGSIWSVRDGRFNMTDPSGYVFPLENGNRPFDLFRVEDRGDLELFARHLQPRWKIPRYQRVLDWISGLSFVGAWLVLAAWGIRRLRRRAA